MYAAEILKKYKTGKVHSVYRKTVNLSFGEYLVAIQSAGSPVSPVSLITDSSEKQLKEIGAVAGTEVYIKSDSIRAGDAAFLFESAAAIECGLRGPLPQARLKYIKAELKKKLEREEASIFCRLLPGHAMEGEGPLDRAVQRCLRNTGEYVTKGQWKQAAEELSFLVGLGTGLTPGGDDFLCGILAGIELGNWKNHLFSKSLRAGIYANLERTNDISRAFLTCAAKGQYGQMIHGFYEKSAEEILGEAKQIGHSSGMDTLCGILYFFELQEGR